MMRRCYKNDDVAYDNYGGRGISVCKRWHDFDKFVDDMHPKPKNKTIDRRHNNQGYSPSNCRWSSRTEQALNRRLFKNNAAGYTGVYGAKAGRFKAQFTYKGKAYIYGGTFATAKEASVMYETLRRRVLNGEDVSDLTGTHARYDSATGIRGITPHKDGGYIVRKTVDGKRVYLGYRKTLNAAKELLNANA